MFVIFCTRNCNVDIIYEETFISHHVCLRRIHALRHCCQPQQVTHQDQSKWVWDVSCSLPTFQPAPCDLILSCEPAEQQRIRTFHHMHWGQCSYCVDNCCFFACNKQMTWALAKQVVTIIPRNPFYQFFISITRLVFKLQNGNLAVLGRFKQYPTTTVRMILAIMLQTCRSDIEVSTQAKAKDYQITRNQSPPKAQGLLTKVQHAYCTHNWNVTDVQYKSYGVRDNGYRSRWLKTVIEDSTPWQRGGLIIYI